VCVFVHGLIWRVHTKDQEDEVRKVQLAAREVQLAQWLDSSLSKQLGDILCSFES